MGSSPTISQQKILEAANGNPALIELLTQLTQTTAQQQSVTGTTPNAAATTSSSARVPPQATGTVSLTAGVYTVEIVPPGGASVLSQLQAAAAGQNLSPLEAVTAIFHQIRASTSPAFNVNSNTQTFGGNTGSSQTLWTLNGLGSGTWYFQFRSSYDGVNWNTWKNANSGTGVGTGIVDQVTVVPAAFSDWALFTLPGKQVMGIVEGLLADQEIMGIPAGYNLYSSGLLAIAGPNGYTPKGGSAFGVTLSDVDLQTPTGGVTGQSGIPDYPVEIRMQYGQSGSANTWPGNASVFGIAFNPEGTNVQLLTGPNNTLWVVFTLPGGCPIAFGQGKNNNGDSIWTPPSLTWMSSTRLLSICSLTDGTDSGNTPHGYLKNQLSGYTLESQYSDGTNTWNSPANWFAIAYPVGANILSAGGNSFIKIPLQGNHSVIFGAGQTASGTTVALPTGYTFANSLSICTPGGFNDAGHHFQGISQCAFIGPVPWLAYLDDSGDTWDGLVNWMVAAWN